MKIVSRYFEDALLIELTVFSDERGYFFEAFHKKKLEQCGFPQNLNWVQDNQSFSKKGVLRGLHYQHQNAQGKFVRVVSGRVYDVVVDLRKHSPYFLKWAGVELGASPAQGLWIPPGFAHGFYALEDAVVIYKTTSYYDPASEVTIRWDDPTLAIQWPISEKPIISVKDQKGLLVAQAPYF